MIPTIGRIVIYRSRTGQYSVPAIITATLETLYRPNVEAGLIPGLSGDEHVHLHVLTPGTPGKRTAAEAKDTFVVQSKHGLSENVGGAYQEFDIPRDLDFDGQDYDGQEPGTWVWPPQR